MGLELPNQTGCESLLSFCLTDLFMFTTTIDIRFAAQSDVTDLAIELEDNINIVNNYQKILQDEVQLRTKLIVALKNCAASQEKEIAHAQEKLQV